MDSGSSALFPEIAHTARRKQKVDPKGYRVVSVRLREGEFVSLSRQTAEMGLTNNMALRIAARRITGFLEIDGNTRQALQSVADSIGRISTDIHELSTVTTRHSNFDIERFSSQKAAFGAEFIELDRLLRLVLNVSRRRTDGCALLNQATE